MQNSKGSAAASSQGRLLYYALLVLPIFFHLSLQFYSMTSLPTIVVIPGAWHSPQHYTPLFDALRAQQYEVVSERLPSVGSPAPLDQSVAKDTAFIRERLLLPQLNREKDVLLVMHSYGSCPGAAATKGLSKSERQAAGKKGGIVGLVFMCAFVATEGASLKSSLLGGVYDPWVLLNIQTGQTTVDNPKDIFYNDVSDAQARWAISILLPHAEKALSSPSGPPAWSDAAFNGKRAYIQTANDHAIPFVAQEAMVTYSGVQWDVMKLQSGHSPFLSHTKEVADFVVAKAKAYDS